MPDAPTIPIVTAAPETPEATSEQQHAFLTFWAARGLLAAGLPADDVFDALAAGSADAQFLAIERGR